jgi:hypothetical protein
MKKVIKSNQSFTIALLLLLSVASLSSVQAQQRVSIGPRLGLNLTDMHGDVSNNSILPGFTGGLFIMYSDVNHFGISGDILFSQKGYTYDNNNNDFKQRINYLEIPVLARYFLNKTGTFRPNLFVGPAIGFKLNAKQNDKTENGRSVADYDNSSDFNSVDFGLVGGIGLNFQVGQGKRILFDARYNYGVSDISKANGSIGNSTISLVFGYGFGVGKK